MEGSTLRTDKQTNYELNTHQLSFHKKLGGRTNLNSRLERDNLNFSGLVSAMSEIKT